LKLRHIDLVLPKPFNEPLNVEVYTIARYLIADWCDDRVCVCLIFYVVSGVILCILQFRRSTAVFFFIFASQEL